MADGPVEGLLDELVDPLHRFLVRRVGDQEAEDLLADVLTVVWRRRSHVETLPRGERLPWAYGVARNVLANHARGERRRRRLAAKLAVVDPRPDEPSAEVAAGSFGLEDERLARAFDALSESDAEVLRLWAWEDLDASRIAAVLDLAPNTASARLSRAKKRLAEGFAGGGHDRGRAGHEGIEGGQR